jgi:hypothetical protein
MESQRNAWSGRATKSPWDEESSPSETESRKNAYQNGRTAKDKRVQRTEGLGGTR